VRRQQRAITGSADAGATSGRVPARSTRCLERRRRLWTLLTMAATILAGPGEARSQDPFLRRTATVQAVEKVGPSVVNITTERVVTQGTAPFPGNEANPFFGRFYQDFFNPRARQAVQSLGSGVIIDRERHVLTNEHVVAGASRIRISLADGREFDASLVGADPNNDLAVLVVNTDETLPWVAPGRSDDLFVGEPVIAIGNPFGLSNTVTTGVISAVDRSFRANDHVYHGFLQTDASINPGNSGGPLVNAQGSLIAINSAVYSGGQGIGFAIPIEVAKRVINELIEHGEIQPVWLGLDFQNLNPSLQEVMELPEGVFGALVSRVRPSSPASRGGLKRGDLVTSVDGHLVAGARDFFQILETVTASQPLDLQIWRTGSFTSKTVIAEEIPPRHIQELSQQRLGLSLIPNPEGGYVVERVRAGSAAAALGIEAGDLVLQVNGTTLKGDEDLNRAILDLRGRAAALIVVQRGATGYHLRLHMSRPPPATQ
jgi:serine protease Do